MHKHGDSELTHFITALTSDAARLIVKEARITNDREVANLIRELWRAQGFVIVEQTEQ